MRDRTRLMLLAALVAGSAPAARARDEDCTCEDRDALHWQLDENLKNRAKAESVLDPLPTLGGDGEDSKLPSETATPQPSAGAPGADPGDDGSASDSRCDRAEYEEEVGWVYPRTGDGSLFCIPCVRKKWKDESCKQAWSATQAHEQAHCDYRNQNVLLLTARVAWHLGDQRKLKALDEKQAHEVEEEALRKVLADLAKKCGWRGTVTVQDERSDVWEKAQKLEGETLGLRDCTLTTRVETRVNYSATARVNGPTSRAGVKETTSRIETQRKAGRISCSRGAWDGSRWVDSSHLYTGDMRNEAEGEADAVVRVGLKDDGSYTLSIAIGEAPGKSGKRSETSEYSGYCDPKPDGKDEYPPPYEGEGTASAKRRYEVKGKIDRARGKHVKDSKKVGTATVTFDLSWE